MLQIHVTNSIQEALNQLPDTSETILLSLAPGVYREKLEVRHSHLIIEGTGSYPEDTTITFGDEAFQTMEDGSKRGTFRSYTMLIDAGSVTLRNLTIVNESTDETVDGQGIALYADGDNLNFHNIRLIGRQDTLFTGPLPPKELQPGGFIGPKQFAPRINGVHHYENCYICGNIDFIFGSATAYFRNCTIESIPRSPKASSQTGYICAPSTPEGQETGYVFTDCHFISSDCEAATCYLARPWRNFAKAVFLHCDFSDHIHPDGFHDWNKEEAHDTLLFGYRHCTKNGLDFIPKASFATKLTLQ